jgi:hypothetical protein
MELVLVCAILGFFLYLCSQTLISTLEMEQLVSEQYDLQRERTFGWSILHRDLQHTVGIYYHHQSFWEAPETKGDGQAPPAPAPTGAAAPEAQKQTKKSLKGTSDELLIFNAEAKDDKEPFLEIVVSRGRVRDPVDKNSDSPKAASSFRKVKYYLSDKTEEGIPEGTMILRTEERWQEAGDSKDNKTNSEEQEFDLDNVRRYAVIMGLQEVELSVYDGKAWVEEWSSLKQGDLPLALRIKYRRSQPEDSETLVPENSDELQSRVLSFPLSYRIVGEPEEEF